MQHSEGELSNIRIKMSKRGEKTVKVEIPFKRRFERPLLDGSKTWTSRTRRFGKRGDTFIVFNQEFTIMKVETRSLGNVAEHWSEEGCESKGDFIEVWRQIHRRRGYMPTQRVYVHIFKKRVNKL